MEFPHLGLIRGRLPAQLAHDNEHRICLGQPSYPGRPRLTGALINVDGGQHLQRL